MFSLRIYNTYVRTYFGILVNVKKIVKVSRDRPNAKDGKMESVWGSGAFTCTHKLRIITSPRM